MISPGSMVMDSGMSWRGRQAARSSPAAWVDLYCGRMARSSRRLTRTMVALTRPPGTLISAVKSAGVGKYDVWEVGVELMLRWYVVSGILSSEDVGFD